MDRLEATGLEYEIHKDNATENTAADYTVVLFTGRENMIGAEIAGYGVGPTLDEAVDNAIRDMEAGHKEDEDDDDYGSFAEDR